MEEQRRGAPRSHESSVGFALALETDHSCQLTQIQLTIPSRDIVRVCDGLGLPKRVNIWICAANHRGAEPNH